MSVSLGMDWDCSPTELPDHARFIRDIDWAKTALGPHEQWPASLHQMVDLVLADPTPASVMWGDRLTMIYNQRFVEFAGSKHPKLMGSTPIIEYAEVWDSMFADIIRRGREKGEATRHKDVRLYLNRHGYLEEVYATYTFVPILGADKTVVGFYHTAIETTESVLAARRSHTLLSLGDYATSARSLTKYWETVLTGFESNAQDVPYAIAYSFKDVHDGNSVSSGGSEAGSSSSAGLRFPRSCTLAGATGKPVHRLPMSFDTSDVQDDFVARVQECTRNGQPLLLERENGTLPEWLYEEEDDSANKDDDAAAAPTADAPISAVVVPIRTTSRNDKEGANAIGFLIIGLNPHLKFDGNYEQFVRLCSRQLATSAASVILLEQEARKQKRLTEQLSIAAKSQQQSEMRFRRFAELADVAIWVVDASGMVSYANKAWRDQLASSEPTPDLASWIANVTDECRPQVEQAWATMVEQKAPRVFECQMQSSMRTTDAANDQDPARKTRWILCSAFPDLADDGSLQGIWACNTDISHQKWAEQLKEQRLADMFAAKRQTENFIDMVSHEMRNPLSAIMQCADGISSSIREAQNSPQGLDKLDKPTLDSILELSQTILFCAQHQTRIVNDILTLSRLDSSLLTIAREAVDPVGTLAHVLKLHQQELLNSKIDSKVLVEDSYRTIGVERVLMDPSRLLQLLINLISNAIKFTRQREKRLITLKLGASCTNPGEGAGGAAYFVPSSKLSADANTEQEGKQDVFILFAVQDTGCGMNEQELKRLFMRFSQATPRTHIQYGGSGLGLFICKELVELCGGRIGVTSEPEIGSTFNFYLPARRVSSDSTVTRITQTSNNETSTSDTDRDSTSRLTVVETNKNNTNKDNITVEMTSRTVQTQTGPTGDTTQTTTRHDTITTHKSDTIHVLVVEDNLINQKIMAQQLRKAGCVVHVANHGADALVFLQRSVCWKRSDPAAAEEATPLSLILMDLEMPVMDGLTCIRKIRQLHREGELEVLVPVLAVTANARPEQVLQAREAGMDDIVTKPVRIKHLMEQMRKWVG